MKIPSAKKLPSGKWRVQVMVDGVRYSITEDSAKVALAKAAAIKAELTAGERGRSAVPLRDAIDAYVRAKTNVLSPSTIREYRRIMDERFPGIMGKNIYTQTNIQIQRAVNEEAAKVSAKTVKNAFSLVHASLAYFKVTAAEDITLPRVTKPGCPRKRKTTL